MATIQQIVIDRETSDSDVGAYFELQSTDPGADSGPNGYDAFIVGGDIVSTTGPFGDTVAKGDVSPAQPVIILPHDFQGAPPDFREIFDGLTGYTIMGWFYCPSSPSGNDTLIFMQNSSGGIACQIRIESAGPTLEWDFTNEEGGTAYAVTVGTPTTGAWNFFRCTVDLVADEYIVRMGTGGSDSTTAEAFSETTISWGASSFSSDIRLFRDPSGNFHEEGLAHFIFIESALSTADVDVFAAATGTVDDFIAKHRTQYAATDETTYSILQRVVNRESSDSDVLAYYPLLHTNPLLDFGPNALTGASSTGLVALTGPFREQSLKGDTAPEIQLPTTLTTGIHGLTAFTVMGWHRVNKGIGTLEYSLALQGSTSNDVFTIRAESSGDIESFHQVSPGGTTYSDTIGQYKVNAWEFFRITVDLDNDEFVYRLGFDSVDTVTARTYSETTIDFGTPVTVLGRFFSQPGQNYYYSGLAHFIFIESALTSAEVDEFALAGLITPGISPLLTFQETVEERYRVYGDIAAYYPLLSADPLTDDGPLSLDATAIGGTASVIGPFAELNLFGNNNPDIDLPTTLRTIMNGYTGYTVIGWAYIPSTLVGTDTLFLVNTTVSGAQGCWIRFDSDFDLLEVVYRNDDSSGATYVEQIGTPVLDAWNFFRFSVDLDNDQWTVRMGIDGEDITTAEAYPESTFDWGTTTGNTPSFFNSNDINDFFGGLAHWVFIRSALTTEEVNSFANATIFTPIPGNNQALYAIVSERLAKHAALYAGPVYGKHLTSYSMAGFHKRHQSSYGISGPVWVKQQTQYAINDYDIVLAKNQALHASPVLAKQQTQWGLSAPIYAKHADSYELSSFNTILAKNQSLYALPVLAKHQAPYAYPPAILAKHETEYGLHGGILAKHESAYEMLSFNRVLARHGDIYELLPDATPYTAIQDHYLTVGTRRFQVQNADVSMSEGDLGWSANITLARRQDAYQFVTNTDFTMTIGVTTWTLRVDRIRDPYQVSTSDISADITIQAKSPALFTVGQFAETIDVEYPNTVMAKTAAEEIAEQSIDWQTVDWPITGGSLVFEKISRLDAVKKIAEAVGASLESKPDGTLSVISRVPVAVPLLPSAAATAVTDRVIYSREVVNTHQIGINKVEVLSVLATNQDTMEATVDPEDWRFFDVAAYVSPWRTQMTITDTHSDVSLYRQGNRTEQLTETVEFIDGQASVSKPIYQINSVTWQTSSLGSTSFVSDTNQIISSTRGYSLAEVVYTVRYLAYRAYSEEEISAQLLLNDLSVS